MLANHKPGRDEPAAALLCALLAASLSPAPCGAQAAVLYKNRAFTALDRAVKGANNYGDLQGPAIENRHFGLFISVMEAHIHADMIGKRIPGFHLHNFSGPYDRHGGWDWGEDVLRVGATLAAGTPGLLVDGSIRTFDIDDMDSLVVHVVDSSAAHPQLRVLAYGWQPGLPASVDFHWTLRTRPEDRHMEGEVTVRPATGVTIALGVIKAFQAGVRRDSALAQLAMSGLPTYWQDSAILAVRSAPEWFRGFFDQEGSVGLRLVPDSQGTVRWTQGASWIQEPSPVWREKGWETSWLPAPEGPVTGVLRPRAGRAAGGGRDEAGGVRIGAAAEGKAGRAAGWTFKWRRADGRLVAVKQSRQPSPWGRAD